MYYVSKFYFINFNFNSFKKIKSWNPNGDLLWSSNLGRINMIENFDKDEFDFINILKERTQQDYGLKYEIITINNGTASIIYSNNSTLTPLNSPQTSMSLATPLALTLRINMLIRCNFAQNAMLCQSNILNYNENLRFLWNWFESKLLRLLFKFYFSAKQYLNKSKNSSSGE